MAVFVLVHGTWGGGWEWAGVARHLRAAGHEVYPLTLSGLGDRSHLTSFPIDLSVHVQDVVQTLYFEDLSDVLLVGWSYGGAVADGVADLVPERLARVINLDGEVVAEGRSGFDGLTEQDRAEMREMLDRAKETGWIPPPTADDLADALSDPALREWAGARVRPHPFATWLQPYPDRGGRRWSVPHTYLRCTGSDWDEEPQVTALRSDQRWRFREIDLNHLGMFYDPAALAAALADEVAP